MKIPNKATIAIIKKAVESALPKGREFKIILDPTSVKGYYTLRVITTAWRRLHRMNRILKINDSLLSVIPLSEKRRIFRVSVMTPDEWQEFLEINPRKRKITVLAKSPP